MHKIVIIDSGIGNLNSVKRILDKLGANVIISSEIKEIITADKLLLPGVGQFSFGMESLNRLNLIETLNEMVLIKKKPILGICLGMQLMTGWSEEGDVKGLSWFDADTVRFKSDNAVNIKIPHVGWNTLAVNNENMLMKNVTSDDYYYFVHSYHVRCNDSKDILTTTDYGYNFVSSIRKENIFGVQFHPEKSYESGEKIISNFINL